MEGGEDTRGLEDRAAAALLAEDLGRVPLRPLDLEQPGAEPAAAGDRDAGHVPLERERGVAAAGRLDEGGAADRIGPAGLLFVAGEEDDHLPAFERPGGVERAQRRDEYEVAPFMSEIPVP